jgi:protein lifeguard
MEAAGITLVVVLGLTLYAFWAAKKGYDFEFLGPFLVAACLVLVLFSFVRVSENAIDARRREIHHQKLVCSRRAAFCFFFLQILFPMGKTGTMVYGCVAALVFSGFIIYDTDNLIKRYTYDEYVSAAIELYLDIINLFMAILNMLEGCE